MPASLSSLLDQMREAAATLRDAEAWSAVEDLVELHHAPKTLILVIGATGSGRASVVNALLEQPDLLPRSPLPRAPIPTGLRYGPAERVEVVQRDGTRHPLPLPKLRRFLADPNTTTLATSVEIEAPCELLTLCELRVEPLPVGLDAAGGPPQLSPSDFTILVLNATALLSQQERDFIRHHLAGSYGLQRVAMVITHLDLVDEEERDSIVPMVRSFLGPFQSQPALLAVMLPAAATQAAFDDTGREGLRTLAADLSEGHGRRRGEALQQEATSALMALETGLARQEALASMDRESVQAARRSISERQDWLHERVLRTQRRVEAFVGTLLKDQAVRAIAGFGDALRNRLPTEVTAIDDIATIKRYLPGYLESVWSQYLRREMETSGNRLLSEVQQVTRMIETDLQDLLGERAPRVDHLLGVDHPFSSPLHAFVMPKRGKHRATGPTRVMSLVSLALSGTSLGLLMGGVTEAIGVFSGQEMRQAEKEAIASAAVAATRDIEQELIGRADALFKDLSTALKEEVASIYDDALERIEEVLSQAETHGEEAEARRAELEALAGDTLPDLRRQIDALQEMGVA
jgi:hypothetical protein